MDLKKRVISTLTAGVISLSGTFCAEGFVSLAAMAEDIDSDHLTERVEEGSASVSASSDYRKIVIKDKGSLFPKDDTFCAVFSIFGTDETMPEQGYIISNMGELAYGAYSGREYETNLEAGDKITIKATPVEFLRGDSVLLAVWHNNDSSSSTGDWTKTKLGSTYEYSFVHDIDHQWDEYSLLFSYVFNDSDIDNYDLCVCVDYEITITHGSITPTGLKAAAGDSKVTVTWDSVASAEMYRVYTVDGSTYTRVYSGNGTSTSAEITGLTNGKTYNFVVTAKVNGEWSDYSESVSATPVSSKPVITGYKPGDYKVKLEWTALDGAEMYRVYTYHKGVYTRAFTCDGDRNVATVTGLNGGIKYGFVVSAKVNGAWTDYSDTSDLVYAVPTGVTKPAITGYKAGDYQVKLEWTPIPNASMYRVYTYENGVYTRQFTCNGDRTVATVTGLNGSKTYSFVVSAKVGNAWSDYSDENDLVSVRTTGARKPEITGYKTGDGKVKIEWEAVKGAEMYRVYTYANGTYTRQFTCDGDRNVATVTGLKNGKQYAFVVSAKVNGAWTDYTNEAFFVYAMPNA